MTTIADVEARKPRGLEAEFYKVLSPLGFALFIFLNFVLLVRPGELWEEVDEWSPYLVTMLLCLAIFWPMMIQRFWLKNLLDAPITVCVLLLAPVLIWSIVWNGRMDLMTYGTEFVKVVIYYLLLVSVVTTPARIRIFALSLAVMISIVGFVALANHYEWLELETLQTLIDKRSNAEGKRYTMERIQSVGIFMDPNDLAHILGVGVVLCVYGIEVTRIKLMKLVWLVPMGITLWAIYMTQSRGGVLGLFAGLGILFLARFGIKKAVLVGALVMPAMLYVFAGRATSISTSDDSSQSRVRLWSDAMEAMRENPLFGSGAGTFTEYAGQVAHNSFLQFFAETGVPGGFLFLAAYGIAIYGVLRLRFLKVTVVDEELAKLAPALAAALVCYLVGMLSLTRSYVIPTYLMLGISTVFLLQVRTQPATEPIRLSLGLLGKMFAVTAGYLVAMHLFVRMFVRWSWM